ncbi:VapE domain-containing protein [Synechocystis sp. PCC 7509]|uniref:VapE domain-containing protein n=1 Tax=Synechocystis sp. PCC 7509 TaxID=927677 RepID=UPI0002ACC6D3|nr:VapE domain-containing protein [Synechocystis sp. PCC 7509]
MTYSIHSAINKTIQYISSLGLSALPVVPQQPQIKNADGKLIFTGKNPSYFDAMGKPCTINHSEYADRQPTDNELRLWFSSPQTTGVGALGSDSIVFIDIDLKNFASDSECNRIVMNEWLAKRLPLQSCWREKTRGGGYRLAVRLSTPATFTNFKFTHFDRHCGEVIGKGRFAVLAPTPGYKQQTSYGIVSIDSLDSVGIISTKTVKEPLKPLSEAPTPLNTQTAIQPPNSGGGASVSIYSVCSQSVKDLLNSTLPPTDRSLAITKVIKELYGWQNYLSKEGKHLNESIDDIIKNYAECCGLEPYKLARIKSSIDLDRCQPSKSIYADGKFQPLHMTAEKNVISYLSAMERSPRYNTLTLSVEYEGQSTTAASLIELKERMYLDVGVVNLRKVSLANKEWADAVVDWAIANNSYSPIAEYLNSLQPTASDVLDELAERMGIVAAEKVWLTKWLLQCVERPLNSGCDAPYMLVFHGSQGCGKTFTLNTIAKQWFIILNPKNAVGKDGLMLFHRGWVICNDELSTLSKYDIESLKSEITTTVDAIRLPYRADVQQMRRSSVLCGTTNNAEFLKDGTGNRRFLVVHFRNTFTADDREWLNANVDRLWSHVVHLKQSGVDYHLTDVEASALIETQKSYRVLTETDELVIRAIKWWLSNTPTKTLPIAVTDLTTLTKQCGGKLTTQRVSKTLKGLGFETDRIGRGTDKRTIVLNPHIVNEFVDVPISSNFSAFGITLNKDSVGTESTNGDLAF